MHTAKIESNSSSAMSLLCKACFSLRDMILSIIDAFVYFNMYLFS